MSPASRYCSDTCARSRDYSIPGQMMKHGIYSVTDGRKLVKLLTGMFIIVSIIYFLFGRKTSHDTNQVCDITHQLS